MEKQNKLCFQNGIKDGIPIALGYLSVSFTFGMSATAMGIPLEAAVVISLTNLTSAGQFAALELITAFSSYTEMLFTQLLINLRYALMSLSLSQRLEKNTSTGKRMLMSYGITDEIFATASTKDQPITCSYFCGLMLLPICGWTLGTWMGGAAAVLLPVDVRDSMGIAIYGMFLAIFIPPAKRSSAILNVVLFSAILSCVLDSISAYLPVSSVFALILFTLLAAAYGAWRFPIHKENIK